MKNAITPSRPSKHVRHQSEETFEYRLMRILNLALSWFLIALVVTIIGGNVLLWWMS